jgi:hypothetical protein
MMYASNKSEAHEICYVCPDAGYASPVHLRGTALLAETCT